MESKTIILSIHPNHIEKILSGEKRYEYRKRIPQDIDYLIVYATAPIKKVVAIIEVDMVMKDNIYFPYYFRNFLSLTCLLISFSTLCHE